MLQVDTIVARGVLLAPVPDTFDVIAAERFIGDRFKHERCVVRLMTSQIGTGKLGFELQPNGRDHSGVVYRVAIRLADLEIPASGLFEVGDLARAIHEVPFLIASAVGGEAVFQVRADLVLGLKVA